MSITEYRSVDITTSDASDRLPQVVLSTDDQQGRILRFELWNGDGTAALTTGLSARFYIEVNDIPYWQDMELVSGAQTATWTAAPKMGNITAGNHRAEVRVTDTDGGIVATRPFIASVQRGVIDGADSEVMENAADLLAEVETINLSLASDGTLTLVGRDGTVTTSTAAKDATTSANTAANAANTAATAANDAADAANDAAARAETAAKPTEEMFASVHELLRAGSADAVTGSGDAVSATFLQRASNVEGARDGVATIECIRGNTVGWNQLAIIDNSHIAENSGTKTFDSSTNEWTFTSNGNPVRYFGFYTRNSIIIPANHKCVIGVDVKLGTAADVTFGCSSEVSTFNVGTTYSRLRLLVDPTENKAITCYTTGGEGVTMMAKNIQLFDLTQMFGAGNEPSSVEEFERMYPLPYYAYNAGSLKPVAMTGIESTGFNLFDASRATVGKGVIAASGDLSTNNGLAASDYIEVFPNTEYCACTLGSSLGSNTYGVAFYDANKEYISGVIQKYRITTATSPANARYARFNVYANALEKGVFHLRLNGTRDGEYEAYWKSQRAIDIAQYFPTGLKRAGTARDALYEDHADTVVGSVDLGTLNWSLSGNGSRFLYYFSEIPARNIWNNIGFRLSTSRYRIGQVANETSETNDKTFGIFNGYLYVRDTVYTTVEELKAAMSGVILYYELATPTVTPIDPPLNLSYRVDTFGTERIVTPADTISAPPTMDISYGYTAESLRDEALAVIAPVENHRAATNHAVGSYVIHDAQLYRVTRAIAANEEFAVGTNVTATTVMAEVAALNN